MVRMDSNHWQILESTIAGRRPADEQSFDALAVLTERLRRVKKLGEPYASIGFSSHVERLKANKNPVTVG